MKRDHSISLTYLPPRVRVVFMLDMEIQILNSSNDQETLTKVDPLVEEFYGKTESHNDYLIKL